MLRAPKTARAAAPSLACPTTTGPSPALHHAAASRTPAPRGAATSSPCCLPSCGTATQQQHHHQQHWSGRAVLPVPRCLGPSTSDANGAGGHGKQQRAGPQQQRQQHGASSAASVSGQGANAASSRAVHPELSGDGDDDLLYPEFTAYNPPQGWVKLYTPQALSSLAQQPPHQSPLHQSLTASFAAGAGLVDGQWAGTFSDDEVCVPPPSNLPTAHHCSGSSSSSAALPHGQNQPHHGQHQHSHQQHQHQQPEGPLFVPRKDMWTLTGQPGIDMLLAGPMAWGRLPQVFVILFGVGERDTEGIYSLRAFADDGLPQETIIAFESEEDAQQYAGLLEATMEHTPNVCSIPPRELLDFCVEQGYACRLEPQGSLLIPPDYNVGVTDWERSLRLREGRWAVLDEEPSDLAPSSGSGIGSSGGSFSGRQGATMQRIVASLQQQQQQPPSAQHQHQQPSGQQQQQHLPGGKQQAAGGMGGMGNGISFSAALARYSPFTGDLEAIRAKLEKLLPSD